MATPLPTSLPLPILHTQEISSGLVFPLSSSLLLRVHFLYFTALFMTTKPCESTLTNWHCAAAAASRAASCLTPGKQNLYWNSLGHVSEVNRAELMPAASWSVISAAWQSAVFSLIFFFKRRSPCVPFHGCVWKLLHLLSLKAGQSAAAEWNAARLSGFVEIKGVQNIETTQGLVATAGLRTRCFCTLWSKKKKAFNRLYVGMQPRCLCLNLFLVLCRSIIWLIVTWIVKHPKNVKNKIPPLDKQNSTCLLSLCFFRVYKHRSAMSETHDWPVGKKILVEPRGRPHKLEVPNAWKVIQFSRKPKFPSFFLTVTSPHIWVI